MGDFVGQHPVFAELEVLIAGQIAELFHCGEHVDGQAFESAVHASETQHRIGAARRFEQHGVLGVLADLAAHPIAELHADFYVTSFVPTLAGHVELQRKRSLGAGFEIPAGAPGAFERLDLAHKNAVHQAACTIAGVAP